MKKQYLIPILGLFYLYLDEIELTDKQKIILILVYVGISSILLNLPLLIKT